MVRAPCRHWHASGKSCIHAVCESFSRSIPTLTARIFRNSRVIVDRSKTVDSSLVNMASVVENFDILDGLPTNDHDIAKASIGSDLIRLDINGTWPVHIPFHEQTETWRLRHSWQYDHLFYFRRRPLMFLVLVMCRCRRRPQPPRRPQVGGSARSSTPEMRRLNRRGSRAHWRRTSKLLQCGCSRPWPRVDVTRRSLSSRQRKTM